MIVEANDLINIFQTCFQVCLAFTVLFFIITVILFFLFDIRAIFNIRTGRAKNKTIKEMQQANSNTGRLRVGGKTLTSKLEKAKKGKDAVVSPPPHKQLNNNYNQPSYDNSGAPTDVLQDNSSNTEVLKILHKPSCFLRTIALLLKIILRAEIRQLSFLGLILAELQSIQITTVRV